jgi:hypothetical protein
MDEERGEYAREMGKRKYAPPHGAPNTQEAEKRAIAAHRSLS